MKKTIALLGVLAAGAASAADLEFLGTWSGAVTQGKTISMDTLGLTSTIVAGGTTTPSTGFTVVAQVTDWTPKNRALFYFVAGDLPTSNPYTKSALTVGWSSGNDRNHAVLYTSAGGASTSDSPESTDAVTDTLPSHGSAPLTTTLVATVTGTGAATLYEQTANGLVTVGTYTYANEGALSNMVLGTWSGSGASDQTAGNLSLTFYQGSVTKEEAAALIPEPATATLSLLALAGLAARRRRK